MFTTCLRGRLRLSITLTGRVNLSVRCVGDAEIVSYERLSQSKWKSPGLESELTSAINEYCDCQMTAKESIDYLRGQRTRLSPDVPRGSPHPDSRPDDAPLTDDIRKWRRRENEMLDKVVELGGGDRVYSRPTAGCTL